MVGIVFAFILFSLWVPDGKFDPNQYKLVFNGKLMQNKQKLADFKFTKGCTIHALPKFAEDGATSILDLVFVVDCTGSMGPYIQQIQANIISIADQLVALESANINFGLVTYRDVRDRDNLVSFGFDPDVKKMKAAVDHMKHSGGDDAPEMLASGLDAATRLKFRDEATKICVLITDAPPHGIESSGDNYPDGDPNCRDLLAIVRDLAAQGVIMFSVGCEPSISSYPRSQCFMKWYVCVGLWQRHATCLLMLRDQIEGLVPSAVASTFHFRRLPSWRVWFSLDAVRKSTRIAC
jgi:hypothetical protein